MGVIRSLRGSLRRSRVAGTCLALVVLLGVGFAVERAIDSPDRVGAEEFDGRTWLNLPAGDGDGKLVLANGISGLVEAQATDPDTDAWPVGMRFAGSDRRFTLLQREGAVAVLADGSHHGALVEVPAESQSVLGAAGIVTAGAAGVTVRRLVSDPTDGHAVADAVVVTDEAAVAGAPPVVDADGSVWVLVGAEASTVVRVNAGGRAADRVDVDPGALGLVVIDGNAHVRHSGTVTPLGAGTPHRGAGPGDVTPTVADTTDGAWATASGVTVTAEVSGRESTFDALEPIRSLAVWHGAVWAVAGDVVGRVDGEELTIVQRVDGPFDDVFSDGGRLWFVSATEAIAIDRHQQPTVFALQGLDVQYCVDTCTPDDLNQLGDGRADDGSGDGPTTTTPATTSPVTIPRVTTTAPPSTVAPATTAAPTSSTTTLPPTTAPRTTEEPGPPPTTRPRPTEPAPTQPAATQPAATTPVTTVAPATSIPIPIIPDTVEPIDPGPPQTAPATTRPRPPDTTQPPVTNPPPPSNVQLFLSFADGGGDTTAAEVTIEYGWDGQRRDCAGAVFNSAWADLAASGAANEWWGGMIDRGDLHSATIAVSPGTLTVTLNVCGASTTISRTIVATSLPPQLTGLVVTPEAVSPGESFTATVNYSYGDTWQAAGASWTGGPCGGEVPLSGSLDAASSSVTVPTSTAGTYCVSVIVTFRSDGGEEQSPSDAASIDVVAATTSTSTTGPSTPTSSTPTSSTTSTSTSSTTSTSTTVPGATTSTSTTTSSTAPASTTTSTSTSTTSTTTTSTTTSTRPPATTTTSTSTTTTSTSSTSTSTVAPPR